MSAWASMANLVGDPLGIMEGMAVGVSELVAKVEGIGNKVLDGGG